MPLPSVPMPDVLKGVDDLIRSNLEEFRQQWFVSLLIATGLVAIGLLLEAPEIWHETVKAVRKLLHSCAPETEAHPWTKLAGTLGWLLIVIGVTGEFVFDGVVSRADGFVQKFDEILLADAQHKSAGAYERAARTELEAAQENQRAANALRAAEAARREATGFQLRIAVANERAANAEKEAARLGKMAEDEKLARVKIEQRLAPRTLNSEQQERIRTKLSPFVGTPYELALSDTTEAAALMLTLDKVLRSAGWIYRPSENADLRTVYTLPNGEEAEQFLGTGVQIGLSKSLQSVPKYKRAAEVLISALREEAIDATDTALPDNNPSPNAIHIKVGNKQ